MSVRTAFSYFKPRVASPVGGSAPSVASAKDVETAFQQTNAYLDQWLGKPSPSPSPSPSPAPSPASSPAPMLRRGSGGGNVTDLQERLKALGFDPGPIDGAFGPRTVAAVRRFQEARGIRVDGIVGPETYGELGIRPKAQAADADHGHAHAADGHVKQTPDGQMVGRQGKLISVKVAAQFDKMVAAAKADGVTLSITSAYRSYHEQVELWNRFGRNPARVARPGHSNHQKGEAIDFANTSGAWAWLKRNATKFGFHNYDPEPWHYSLTGN